MDFDLYIPVRPNKKRCRDAAEAMRKAKAAKHAPTNTIARSVPRAPPITKLFCRLVTLCSGIEAVCQGCENMHLPHEHLVACEIDAKCRRVIEDNFQPGLLLEDVAAVLPQIPDHDMLWAGAPCQPFSLAGRREGLIDQTGRGVIILHVLRIIKATMPKIVVLENVSALTQGKQKTTFEGILQILREIRHASRHAGLLHYHVDWRVMNTCDYGVPQSRQRLYIVCVRSDVMQMSKLPWPMPPETNLSQKLDSLLGPRPDPLTVSTALPPPHATTARANVLAGLQYLRGIGRKPFEETHVLNIDDSPWRLSKPMKGCSPCLTQARARVGGHWISTHGRRMGTETMLKLQHMNPDRLRRPTDVGETRFNAMIGNAMSVNIVEVLLAMLSRACPKALNVNGPLPCQWGVFED